MEHICKNCLFWGGDKNTSEKKLCEKISSDQSDVAEAHGDNADAWLVTSPNFGCVEWSPIS